MCRLCKSWFQRYCSSGKAFAVCEWGVELHNKAAVMKEWMRSLSSEAAWNSSGSTGLWALRPESGSGSVMNWLRNFDRCVFPKTLVTLCIKLVIIPDVTIYYPTTWFLLTLISGHYFKSMTPLNNLIVWFAI